MTEHHLTAGSAPGARRMLAVMASVHVFYALDRTIPGIVAEPVKQAFSLSDTQLGLLLGLAYGASFAVASLLIGPIIDRTRRVNLLAAMLALWSLATAACGLATGFAMLLAMRVLVGIAEAGSSPAAFSLLSDIFPPSRRGMAIGVYKIGAPVGIMTASLVGAHVAERYGWRAAFLVAGVPGILLALVAWRGLDEPVRGALERTAAAATPTSVRGAAMRLRRTPGALPLMLGIVVVIFAGAGVSAFTVPFLQRTHGMSLADAGASFALASSFGALTLLALGLVADRLAHTGLHRSLWFSAVTALLVLVCGSVMLLAPARAASLGGLYAWQMMVVGITAPNYAALLSITPPSMRGTVTALLMLGTNLIGLGGAPTFVGALSDLLGSADGLRLAMLADLAFCAPAAALFFHAGRQVLRTEARGCVGTTVPSIHHEQENTA